ncbi:MAG: hypothetical protein ABW352_12040 [Polyangiales bacterium]
MNLNCVRSWSTIAACVAVLACGDDGDNKEAPQEGRATILNSSAAMIAASALSDMPAQDFVVARSRVQERVPAPRQTYARGFSLGAGRAASLVADPEVTTTRRLAASALGVSLDPAKEVDVVETQKSIDALLFEVQKIAPAATSCDGLPSGKAEACAIAFLILEVKRSEGNVLPTTDAGTDAGSDAGSDAGTAGEIKCGPRDFAGATEVTGTITTSQTWSGKVVIKSAVYVNDPARITIEPGTEIFMAVDSSLYFSWNGAAGVYANGTAAAPIKICGQVAEKGFWNTLTIGENTTSDSYLRNVLIAEGGGSVAALDLKDDITLDNVQVIDSGKDGVLASDFKADSKLLTVRGAAGYPVVINKQGALVRLPRGGTFAGNTSDQISVSFQYIEGDVTLYNVGVPYAQQMTMYQNSGNFVVEAGVEWRLKSDLTLNFAWNGASSVQMKGTATAPIKLVPVDANSKWGGVTVHEQVATTSVLSYVELSGGGQGRPVLEIKSPIKLDHVSLKQNGEGLELTKLGLAAGSSALEVTGTAGRPVVVAAGGVYSLPSDSKLTGNTIDQVQITAGYFETSGTIPNVGVPYYVNGSTYDSANVAITLAAGTQFVMAADATWNAGWAQGTTLTALGTATQPIKFRGEQALTGYWRGLNLDSSLTSNSKLDYLELSDAGGGGSGGAAIKVDATVAITNTKISNSSGYCIDSLRTLMLDFTPTNTLTCALGALNLH